VQIKTGIQSISAGFEHSLILQTDGSLLGCGKNSNGQLGDNTTIDKYTPVPIMPDVQSMDGGNNYSLIIKKDGTLWACGANDYGQLGDGTIIERHAPVQIKF
jgi:alpha-tubulin suppressor-like RCC1 family protein